MVEVISDFQQVGNEIEEGLQRGRSIWTDKHGSDSHMSLLSTGMVSRRE